VVNQALSTTLFIKSMILNPDTFALAGDIDEIEIRQIKLKSNRVIGSRVQDLELPKGVTVMSIQRKGDILMPDNDTQLRENDTLNLTGTPEYLEESMRLFGSSARSRPA